MINLEGWIMRKAFLPYGLHWIDDEDIEEVVKVLKSDWITTGSKIKEFENSVCEYVNCKYGVAVNSGTSALDIAVACLGLKSGEVITTPFTFVATANSILFNGLKPVFADIKNDTCNINPAEIQRKISDKTRAIIYVDYAGQPCDMEEIKNIAKKYNLFLIEDAAHALGAEYEGRKIGGFADMTVFSFHPVKHITTGEGGMCVTNNEGFAEKMKMLRNHGMDVGARERYGPDASWVYDIRFLSRNYRITDFQAALGISQLKKIERFIKRRREIAQIYNEAFENLSEITRPCAKSNVRHVWHIYTVLLNGINRDKFFELMRGKNVGVNVHYIPVYRHSYYKRFGIALKDFPVTEDIFNRIITLPLFPKMTDEDALYVIDMVKESFKELKRK
jgi:UDP-4-amino-4,6-dideoxy-N-acetyl-beta-L-altrosamine transaminase